MNVIDKQTYRETKVDGNAPSLWSGDTIILSSWYSIDVDLADEGCSVTSYSDDDSVVHQVACATDDVTDGKMSAITCCLETKDLWDKFHQLGTEMIITKSGR